jgi:hypothetical protein
MNKVVGPGIGRHALTPAVIQKEVTHPNKIHDALTDGRAMFAVHELTSLGSFQ